MKTKIEHKCSFIIKEKKCAHRCNIIFTSRYELAAHKKLLGHLSGKKRKHVVVEMVAIRRGPLATKFK